MGRRIELNLAVAAYSRAFGGEQSPRDLETALQLVYRLFTHRVTANAEQLETILRCVSAGPYTVAADVNMC